MCMHRDGSDAVCTYKDGDAVCSAGIKMVVLSAAIGVMVILCAAIGVMVILCAGIGGMVISGPAL